MMGLLRRWYPSQVRVDVHEVEGTGGGAFRGALLVLIKKGEVMGPLRRCCSSQTRGDADTRCMSGRGSTLGRQLLGAAVGGQV